MGWAMVRMEEYLKDGIKNVREKKMNIISEPVKHIEELGYF